MDVEDEDEDDEMFEASASSVSWSNWSEYVDTEDGASEDSLSSHPSDVVEAGATRPPRANVIALMDLKALMNTPPDQVELLLKWIFELKMRGETQRIQVVYDGIVSRQPPRYQADVPELPA